MDDAEIPARIAAAAAAMDLDALAALEPAVLERAPALRSALATAWSQVLDEIEMDVSLGRLPPASRDLVIAGRSACRRLAPLEPAYAIGEAEARIDRAAQAWTADPAVDLAAALALAETLIAGWSGQRVSGPDEEVREGNLVIPRGVRLDDAYALSGRARFHLAALRPDAAGTLAAAAGGAMRTACDLGLCAQHLEAWWRGIGLLADARAAADAGFAAYAAARIAADPRDARHWGAMFTRLAEHDPEALGRAASIWRAYAVDPGLPAWQAGEVGQAIARCARWLGDRELLLRALALHQDALERAPDSFRSGYVAELCTALADLPGTPGDEQRAWYDRAVATCRRHAMPDDDLHFGMHFSALLLARAARFALPADHPDLEEAWRWSDGLIAAHGDHYLLPSEHAAWARLLQGRDGDAAAILRRGLARIPGITAEELAARPWFAALGAERADRLRRRIG